MSWHYHPLLPATAALSPAAPIVLSPSTNIAPGGANTTAQLTAPASGTFGGGRIQDDSSLTAAVDLATNQFREDEWCLKFQAEGVYQFRVILADGTLLDTYTVTPEVTVEAGAPAAVMLPRSVVIRRLDSPLDPFYAE